MHLHSHTTAHATHMIISLRDVLVGLTTAEVKLTRVWVTCMFYEDEA